MARNNLSQHAPVVQTSPFQFKDHPVRTQLEGETLWFAAKDVCTALGIDWSGKTLSVIQDSWQSMGKFPTLRRGMQMVKRINEPAVYKLAFRSNKPQADEFTNWVVSEVLPSIRKTGRYAIEPVPLTPFLQIKVLPKARREQLNELVLAKLTHVPPALIWKARMSLWKAFNRQFSIPQYRLLPEGRMPDAIAFLSSLEIGPHGKIILKGQQALPMSPNQDAKQIAATLGALVEQARGILAALPSSQPQEVM